MSKNFNIILRIDVQRIAKSGGHPVMIFPKLLLFIGFLFFAQQANAQCTTKGQTPSTAFPVCGTKVFSQSTVPICSTNSLYVPGCSGAGNANYANKNPFWYIFTCYETGTLGFTITPKDMKDDYDWQLYDITGRDPNEVMTNENIIVTGNWAGNPGTTGTSTSGVDYIQCASTYSGSESRFAKMPQILKGHTYILLVSHFSDSQSGYDLSFEGGTAVITDDKLPDLASVAISCDATKIFVTLNKKMQCSSVAPDGSDFHLSVAGVNIVSAVGTNCSNSFDMDQVELTLDKPLPPGDYSVIIQLGTDLNSLLDNCDRNIEPGHALDFKIAPLLPTPMNKLAVVGCAPQVLELLFEKHIRCESIAADGSDFSISGPEPVTIVSATGKCADEGSTDIKLHLQKPLTVGGIYTITLKNGIDGNSIIDECGQVTPTGSQISFSIKDTVNADFTYYPALGCDTDTIQLFHPGGNGIDQWHWQMDYAGPSSLQNPVAYFSEFGTKEITLKVSNGFCSDSLTRTVLLDNELLADFEMTRTICPEDSAYFKDKSVGKITNWFWDFGNRSVSTSTTPLPQSYPMPGVERTYPVTLVIDDGTCTDTSVQIVKVLSSCYIDVPTAFTPNNDGLNDFLYPLNGFNAESLKFKVYNRSGLLLFSSIDPDRKWDGTYRGEPQDAGIFVWTLEYDLKDTGQHIFKKGSSLLIR